MLRRVRTRAGLRLLCVAAACAAAVAFGQFGSENNELAAFLKEAPVRAMIAPLTEYPVHTPCCLARGDGESCMADDQVYACQPELGCFMWEPGLARCFSLDWLLAGATLPGGESIEQKIMAAYTGCVEDETDCDASGPTSVPASAPGPAGHLQ